MKKKVKSAAIFLLLVLLLVPVPVEARGNTRADAGGCEPVVVNGIQRLILDIRVKEIAKEIEGLSRYEQIKYAYDYVILNCEYSFKYDGAYNALVRGHACCNGYAGAFLEIMEELNIPCKYTTGEDHAWNTVYLDGYWYNIDTTWGDDGGDEISYDFFLKSNAEWQGAGPAVADAPSSYSTQNLEKRYDFPDFAAREMQYLLAGTVGIVVVLAVLKKVFGFAGHAGTQSRIAKNEELIRNMYHLPKD